MSLEQFHPIVSRWFRGQFAGPTEPQMAGWPLIAAGRHTLIAAPTGSGKTLTAFLAVIDRLLRESLDGRLENEMRVVYVSPLRALSNDMHRNLEAPLEGILAEAAGSGIDLTPIRAGLRTGDTPSHRRRNLVTNPPHILVTTPESLFLMLTAERSREVLKTVDTVIVDEIHALVRDKRGSHLALSLERLSALADQPIQRIGLSATQKPIERMAHFLVGTPNVERNSFRSFDSVHSSRAESTEDAPSDQMEPSTSVARQPAAIVDVGHVRELDLAIETPQTELSAVCSHEQWAEVNARLVELIESHRSTLIFVNTRRLAERITHQLSALLGDEAVSSHHGSLAAELRLDTEQRLKTGRLKAVVATASLELGIDVGYVDLVVQIGSPRSIATFVQRIGRSGHALGLVPKGRLFALTRDELLECMALIRAVKGRRLDVTPIPEAPLDVLAQQIVAETAADDWGFEDLFALCQRAYPYASLTREQFTETVELLSDGLFDRTGRSRALLHYDRVNGQLRGRRGARLKAINNAGAIPEIDSVRVVLDVENTVVGSVDEDFAIESQGGDIFLLGNTSWRIRGLRGNDLIVSDAHGAPPTIPFWRGEAPGRTVELSEEVSRLRDEISQRVAPRPIVAASTPNAPALSPPVLLQSRDADDAASEEFPQELEDWLAAETNCSPHAARQALAYVAAQQAAIGTVPTQTEVVFERFFDESGGMQLVVHAPFGGRINRAWGLAMRKRFCRSFDFELQASADDDGFILSLGPQHSFPIESLFPMLRPDNVRNLLEQALLAVPMFHLRWRWNATRALLVARRRNGKKVPPAIQRFRSEDLLTEVFPKLTGCQENITGDHEIPDHPLVRQTVDDCLHEALDLDGLVELLDRVERGDITFVARDTREPSPFAYELLNANPYAFLDGGEIQERRARAVQTRRSLDIESVRDLGRLDPAAIAQVTEEAQPLMRDADELHDYLLSRVVLPASPDAASPPHEFFDELARDRRALTFMDERGRSLWAATELWPAVQVLFPKAAASQTVDVPESARREWTPVESRLALLRGLMEFCGPISTPEIAEQTGLALSEIDAGLEALEGEGLVLRGRFRPDMESESTEWCHRRLLARIHRLTMAGLRREIEPVEISTFLRFLTEHHGLLDRNRTGVNGLFDVIAQLQGIDLPAVCWERDVLPSRIADYRGDWLDELCLAGEVGWGRLSPAGRAPDKSRPMSAVSRNVPISLYLREDLPWIRDDSPPERNGLSSAAEDVFQLLDRRGAMFATDVLAESRLLPSQLDDALGELVARGLVTADGFSGLRQLLRLNDAAGSACGRRRTPKIVRRRRAAGSAGRWSLWRRPANAEEGGAAERQQRLESWAWQLLRRWGVVFRDLAAREQGAPRWFELVQVFRRLEARGEIRGGRFVRGVSGEQFALGETVRKLRTLRDAEAGDRLLVVSAADPLNLVGVLTDHPRVPRTAGNRIALLDGSPVAALQAGELLWLRECSAELAPRVESALTGRGARVQRSEPEAPATDGAESSGDVDDERDDRPRRTRQRFPSGIPRPMIS